MTPETTALRGSARTCCAWPTRRGTAGPVDGLRPGHLVDVAVRAALLTDAAVRILDDGTSAGPAERIGALCRFA